LYFDAESSGSRAFRLLSLKGVLRFRARDSAVFLHYGEFGCFNESKRSVLLLDAESRRAEALAIIGLGLHDLIGAVGK